MSAVTKAITLKCTYYNLHRLSCQPDINNYFMFQLSSLFRGQRGIAPNMYITYTRDARDSARGNCFFLDMQ